MKYDKDLMREKVLSEYKQYNPEGYKAPISKIRETQRKFYERNRERMLERVKKYQKINREKISVYDKNRDKQKRKARWSVYNHIKYGLLSKKPCFGCGNIKVQAHHEDYSKPLEIIWLCTSCHGIRHRKMI